jgi:hypothetical protein
MPRNEKITFVNFPAESFGPGEVTESGRNVTTSWTLRNLPAVPSEPYGRPFADVSYLTTVVDQVNEPDSNGWRPLGKEYFKYVMDRGSVPSSFIEKLGLDPRLKSPEWTDIEKLYTALRKYFTLKPTNEPYVYPEGLDKRIEEKEGDASDVAHVMAKILDRWEVKYAGVLIRDKRQGAYELRVPSYVWFDRLGVMVTLKDRTMVYDFDRSIASKYEYPWYLNPTAMFAVSDTGGAHIMIRVPSPWREHISQEQHVIALHPGKKATDSVAFALKGAAAQTLRGLIADKAGEELNAFVRSYLESYALVNADESSINDFLNEPTIRIGGRGESRSAAAAVDSFLTLKPKNHLLRHFRSEFPASERHYDVYLRDLFAYTLMWQMSAPPGYAISRVPEEAQVLGPKGMTAQIAYLCQEDTLTVKADILFNSPSVPMEKYAEWRKFLDDANNAMEREIVFKKR